MSQESTGAKENEQAIGSTENEQQARVVQGRFARGFALLRSINCCTGCLPEPDVVQVAVPTEKKDSTDSGIEADRAKKQTVGALNTCGTDSVTSVDTCTTSASTSTALEESVPVSTLQNASKAAVTSTSSVVAGRPPHAPRVPHSKINAMKLETITHPSPHPPPGQRSIIYEPGAPPMGHLISELHTPTPPTTADRINARRQSQ